jgi:hypothetical protein
MSEGVPMLNFARSKQVSLEIALSAILVTIAMISCSSENTPPSETGTKEGESAGEGATLSPGAQYLSESEAMTSDWIEVGAVDMNGKLYPRSVGQRVDKGSIPLNEVEYNLGRSWESFQSSVGIKDTSPTECRVKFTVTVDNETTYEKEVPFGTSQNVSISVEKGLRIKLSVSYASSTEVDDYCFAAWGDARLQR